MILRTLLLGAAHAAVGVHQDDHRGRIRRQVIQAEDDGEPLPAPGGVVALDDGGAGLPRLGRRTIAAVVGDHAQVVARS